MVKTTEIESRDFPGFYEIPGYSKYAISKTGIVIRKDRRERLLGSVIEKGYVSFRLTGDDGKVKTWGRHRLLGVVFKHPGCSIDDLVVNHINGIPGNDSLGNLEWTTYQGNIEHAGACGLTSKCIPISVRDVLTGVVYNFPSAIAFAREVGWTKDKVIWRLKSGEDRVFPELLQYRRADVTTPWKTHSSLEVAMLENHRPSKTLIRHLPSGKVLTFRSLSEAARHLGISKALASFWINLENQPVLPGLIQLKFSRSEKPWRDVSDPYLEYESFSKKKVIVVLGNADEKRIFMSVAECCKAMNLSKTILNQRLLSKGNVVYSDGCRYAYYSDLVVV